MGWTSCSSWERPSDVRREILADYASQPERFEVLDHKMMGYGRRWWMLLRCKSADGTFADMLVLFLIQPSRDGYGCAYKDVSEEMGPCEVDCPLSLLDRATEPVNEYATNWREKVRAYHASRKAGVKLNPGDKIRLTFNQCVYTVNHKVKRSYVIVRDDGYHFRLPPGQFKYVEVVS